MREVYVCYLPADSNLLKRSWLNKMAAWWVGQPGDGRSTPMIHCELFFPSTQRVPASTDAVTGHACGIHFNGTVFMSPKQFSRKAWTFRALNVSNKQYESMRAFCQTAADEKHSFNTAGYLCGVAKPQKQWYCSQLVGAALNHAGVAELTEAQQSHPEHLYVALMPLTYLDTVRQLGSVEF